MNIWTSDGLSVPFEQFRFPDGQPHFRSLTDLKSSTRGVVIETAITTPNGLFDVLLARDVFYDLGVAVALDIRYLMGARMDRRIALGEPETLKVVARLLNTGGFWRVRILDPHSIESLKLLHATPVYPYDIVRQILTRYDPTQTVIIAPDAGATVRTAHIIDTLEPREYGGRWGIRQGYKHRDSASGALSGFSVEDASYLQGKDCLILDDICDGGGTFTGLAAVLTQAGARSVDLFVTHGIFSKGHVEGIRKIYTTDSYGLPRPEQVETFPIVMKDLK